MGHCRRRCGGRKRQMKKHDIQRLMRENPDMDPVMVSVSPSLCHACTLAQASCFLVYFSGPKSFCFVLSIPIPPARAWRRACPGIFKSDFCRDAAIPLRFQDIRLSCLTSNKGLHELTKAGRLKLENSLSGADFELTVDRFL